jgi:hypothetical protein
MSNDNTIPGDLAGPLAGPWTGQHNRFTWQDCVVNYNDIWFFAADWLFNEPNLSYPSATDPGTGNLTVWYKFDDGPGATGGVDPCGLSYITLVDSSGNGRDAALYNNNPFTWAYAGHDGTNYSLNFEPGYRSWVQCPNSVVGGTTGQSFTFWIRYDDRFFMDHTWASVLVFHSNPPGGADAQTMETQLPVPWMPGYVSGPWLRWVNQAISNREIPNNQMQRESTFSSRWNHYALVYDTANTKMVMYRNGEQIGQLIDANFVDANLWSPATTAKSVRLATRSNSSTDASYGAWQGRIDDMRLYSKALSKNEVEWLATDGTKARDMQAVFTEPDNFNSNNTVVLPTGPTVKIINFNDFAVLADYWLDEQQSF